jgi:hypothetical protein
MFLEELIYLKFVRNDWFSDNTRHGINGYANRRQKRAISAISSINEYLVAFVRLKRPEYPFAPTRESSGPIIGSGCQQGFVLSNTSGRNRYVLAANEGGRIRCKSTNWPFILSVGASRFDDRGRVARSSCSRQDGRPAITLHRRERQRSQIK